jgi:hypothetical protein
MDGTEKIANDYLVHLGQFEGIVYEPDGNIPPDFLLNGRIAVEVRRLNQNERTASGLRGLEGTAIQLRMRIGRLLASLGPAKSGATWYVHCRFRRPVPAWDVLRPALRQRLSAFRDHINSDDRPTAITIHDGVELKLFRASTAHAAAFVPGGCSDDDAGGFVFEETQSNVRLCIEETTRKIARVRDKYPEWWLILVDRIGYGVDDCDRQMFREHLGIQHNWDKVILLNPLDHRSAFEI